MTNLLKLSVLMFLFLTSSWAETHLGGKITENLIFYSSGNPYIIERDIVIPQNIRVTIKAGTIFLFQASTGMKLYGEILVEGNIENPVVFTSYNDTIYNPTSSQPPSSVDWDGILISGDAQKVTMRCFRLMYSINGIKSDKKEMKINEAFFAENGKYNIIIKNEVQYEAKDKFSYNYTYPLTPKQPAQSTKQDTTLLSQSVDTSVLQKSKQDNNGKPIDKPDELASDLRKKDINKKIRIKKISSIGIFSTSVASGIGGLFFLANYSNKLDEFEKTGLDKTRRNANRSAAFAWIFGALSVIGMPSSSIMYYKQYKLSGNSKINFNTSYNIFEKTGTVTFLYKF